MYPDLRVDLANTEIQRDQAMRQLAKTQEQLTAAGQNQAYLLQDHRGDWARIRTLEADVRALAEALTLYVNNPSHYAPRYPFGWCAGLSPNKAKGTLARPSVKRLMEVTE